MTGFVGAESSHPVSLFGLSGPGVARSSSLSGQSTHGHGTEHARAPEAIID